jgi:hypothetical protein
MALYLETTLHFPQADFRGMIGLGERIGDLAASNLPEPTRRSRVAVRLWTPIVKFGQYDSPWSGQSYGLSTTE